VRITPVFNVSELLRSDIGAIYIKKWINPD